MTNLERHKNMTAEELSKLHYFGCPYGFQPAGFGSAAYETCGAKNYKKCEACKKAWLEGESKV